MQGLHKPLAIESLPDPVPGEGRAGGQGRPLRHLRSDLHMTEDPPSAGTPATCSATNLPARSWRSGKGAEGVASATSSRLSRWRAADDCASCLAGEPAWCAHFGLQGGGYAEYALTRPNQCVILPRSASLADGAIIEPLAVALHGVNMSGLKTGDRILILGAGPIGLAVAFLGTDARVRARSSSRTSFPGRRSARSGWAPPPSSSTLRTRSARPTARSGAKADIVFECVGIPGLIAQAVGQVRNRGTILLLGLCTRPDTFDSFAMLSKEIRLVTSAFFTRQEYEAALDALDAGAPEPRRLVTDTIGLDAVPEIFEALKQRPINARC
jgi:(R,R)-butanediol dehydrogenase/meso-butanediol dehydrogenase/diacetyl reductase